MDSTSPSPPASADPSSSQPKLENRGRKKLPESDPNATRRSLQLREAQRVHREKKQQHLKDLEDTVATLREENKEVQALKEQVKALQFELNLVKGSSICVVCSTTLKGVSPTEHVKVKVDDGGRDVSRSGSEAAFGGGGGAGVSGFASSVSPESDLLDFQMTELDTFLSSVVPKMLTSEELYGPLEVDAGRLMMRTIPSLKGSSDPDRMFDLLVEHSRASDFTTAKRIKLKLIRTGSRMMQQTSADDRPALFELIAIMQERNLNHFRYITTFWGTMLPVVPPFIIDPNKKIHRLMLAFQPRFLQIPSLSNSLNDVNDFCFTWVHATEFHEPSSFFRIHICMAKLVLLCSVKDRAAFFSLVYEMRTEAKDEMEDLLLKMEATTLY
ncbi:hypothetical protein BCR33DRAFT_719642 [Rhizoclosmatium globosum]|uniref:BZIP domain-containing protein n=1 Tax=Rhizoclosmatium globosum TaxID=329046 RepID=A0A1Y2BYH5_9FUNG|nr:hypothetical protein BCR33DRAFT_719642 [Rhizoclosmatium globosum]|eukprot:ORY39818.1 hypothetical protein BCR33DRAFT_719642 [Rhizoclosmatium globosum]